MKAIVFRYLFVALAAVLFLIIAFGIYDVSAKMFEDKSLELLRKFKTYKPYVFNINDFIVDPNDPTAFNSTKQDEYYTSGSDPTFCKDVRSCIEENIKGGEPCLITYKVKPGTPFNINSFKSALAACSQTTIKEELYGNTQRKICEFKPITNYNELREDNISIIDYEPYLHNCYLPDNLGSLNVLNDVDSINYLYSGRGNTDGYSFENGGIVRILVTNVSLKKDFDITCSYSLYVCGQNSIGTKVDETTVQVFKKVQNLDERDLYYNKTINWNGPEPSENQNIFWYILCVAYVPWPFNGLCPGLPSFPAGYNIYGYFPHNYEFSFKSLVPNKEMALIDAVDAGMWEWNKVYYNDRNKMKYFFDYSPDIGLAYFSYSPIADINSDSSINYNSGCWNTNFENSNAYDRTMLFTSALSLPDNTFTDYKIFKHIFNFSTMPLNLVSDDKLRMTLGVKKIFITGKTYTYNNGLPGILYREYTTSLLEQVKNKYNLGSEFKSRVILVLDSITFCSSGTSTSCSCFGPCPPGTTLQCNPVGGQCCITTSPSCGCSDGTSCNSCSSNKPKYCDASGNLIDGCGAPYNCGCPNPSTDTCNADGTCTPFASAFGFSVSLNPKTDTATVGNAFSRTVTVNVTTTTGTPQLVDVSVNWGSCPAPIPGITINWPSPPSAYMGSCTPSPVYCTLQFSLSGTPTAANTYCLYVWGSTGSTSSGDTYTLTVSSAPPPIPPITWPSTDDLLTENSKVGTIKIGATIISVTETENIDASSIDVVWFDTMASMSSFPIEQIDQNIKKQGMKSINSTLDYVSFVFADTSSNPLTLSSININQFKSATFYLMLNSTYFNTNFNGYLQFIDINGNQANISLGSVQKNIWNFYQISLADPNWKIDSGFDRTKVTNVNVGSIASTHLVGDYAWLDDFYFTEL